MLYKRSYFLFLVLVWQLFAVAQSLAAGLDSWFIRETGFNINDVIYNNGKYVAVGDKELIITSSDGQVWQAARLGPMSAGDHFGIAFGNTRYVAVGGKVVNQTAQGLIHTSTDLLTWSAQASNSNNYLRGVVYGGQLFVAVGDYGNIVTSPDGITWTLRNSNTSEALYAVTYGNSSFVAVGNMGTILTSPDGITWTGQTSNTLFNLNAVEFLGGQFVVVGNNGQILTSDTGASWTLRSSSVANHLYTVTYGNSKYVAAGIIGNVITSTNGIDWDSTPTVVDIVPFSAMVYAANQFLAVGARGNILVSGDASGWTTVFPDSNYLVDNLSTIAYLNNRFYTGGARYTLLSSDNGHLWLPPQTPASIGDYRIRGFAYRNSVYVAVAAYTTSTDTSVFTSTDGQNWTAHNLGLSDSMQGVAFGNNAFVAVGYNTAYTSTNGINWSTSTTTGLVSPEDIAFGNNLFVAVGGTGKIVTSTDGVAWTPRTSGTTNRLTDIAYINNVFLVTGWDGTLLSSPDGVDWTKETTHTTEHLYGITYTTNTYVIGGANGTLLTFDGVNYATRDTKTGISIYAVEYGADTIVAVGDEATILQSDVIVVANEPDIVLSPTSLDFGTITIGTSSSAKSLSINNVGNQGLTIGTLSISGTDAASFAVQNDLCSSVTVVAGGNCSVDLVFSSAAIGGKIADLLIPSNDPDRPIATVALIGSGSAVPEPDITVSDSVAPASDLILPFGNTATGTAQAQTVTIGNNGAAQLNVSGMQVTGTDPGEFSLVINDGIAGRCSSLAPTIEVNDGCTVSVVFTPSSTGDKSATFSINSNDPDVDTVNIALSGTGVEPAQKSENGGGGGGGCFIATAAYDSYLHDDVKVLRDFRDRALLTNSLGRRIVTLYYQYSPPIAVMIAHNIMLKWVTRILLTLLVYALKYLVLAVAIFLLLFVARMGCRRYKRNLVTTLQWSLASVKNDK